MLSVESPGVLSLVQDLGRPGAYRLGIPPAGAADRRAHCAGNWLVGNAASDATLEVALRGPKLRVEGGELLIAFCGGDAPLSINGSPRESWTAHLVGEGDQIEIGMMAKELRGNLAVSGGLLTPKLMGSRSTYLLGGMGGLEGRALRRGDTLPTESSPASVAGGAAAEEGRSVPAALRPSHEAELEISFVVGLFSHLLSPASLDALTEAPWTVKNESNRVGYRLDGPRLEFKPRVSAFGAGADPSNVVDAGYPVGSLMVPSGEEGILGMWEAVTAGGFATVGTAVRSELDRLAQARPGHVVRFRSVDIEEARAVRAESAAALKRIQASLAAAGASG